MPRPGAGTGEDGEGPPAKSLGAACRLRGGGDGRAPAPARVQGGVARVHRGRRRPLLRLKPHLFAARSAKASSFRCGAGAAAAAGPVTTATSTWRGTSRLMVSHLYTRRTPGVRAPVVARGTSRIGSILGRISANRPGGVRCVGNATNGPRRNSESWFRKGCAAWMTEECGRRSARYLVESPRAQFSSQIRTPNAEARA